MSALEHVKSQFFGVLLACLMTLAGWSLANAGPVFAQNDTNLGARRGTETLQPVAQDRAPAPANIGNPGPASGPEKRVALVIGNSAYENVTALPNPASDAKAISQFLNSAGFEVIQATDLDHDEMIQVLQDFSAKISERGPNTVAFVYYAGHGLQIAGDNYLVPVDAKIGSESDVPNAAIRLVDVMATLQAVPSRMRIVVLDACRNNPFSQLKDTGRGLAIVDAPNGSIVGYSTAPGTEAFDGEGKNSPYTSAFLRLGREPNLPIEQFFKKVRVVVNDVTEGKQTPWESSSLTNDFYFFGDTAVAAAKTVNPALSANASMTKPTMVASNVRTRAPRDAYNYVVQEDTVEYYEEFVRIYPYDPFASHIRRLLAAKLLAAAWHGAVIANSPLVYKSFYNTYSDSPYASLALKLEAQPKVMPLYQPTKIMVAPQLAPQIKLTNFNGVTVPQGGNAPIGLGGNNGSLFNGKKPLIGNPQGLGGQTIGLNGNGSKGNPLVGINNAGQGGALPNNGQIKTAPGVNLATGVNKIDTKIDGNRVSTLPRGNQPLGVGAPANGSPGNGSPANGAGSVLKKDGTGLTGNTIPGHRGTPTVSPVNNGPAIVRKDLTPRVTSLPARQVQTTPGGGQIKRFQPAARFNNNAGGNIGGRSAAPQFRGTKTMSMGNGGGGGGGGGRFASGGASFGRSFR